MSLFSLVESRFKAQSLVWLAKKGNFLKHQNYLRNTVLKGFEAHYDDDEFQQALSLCLKPMLVAVWRNCMMPYKKP